MWAEDQKLKINAYKFQLPSSFMPNLGRMMLCQALSVLLLVISTLKSVIGQSHRYYLANFLCCINFNSLNCGFRKEVFPLHLVRLCCSYYTIYSWLYHLAAMMNTNYTFLKAASCTYPWASNSWSAVGTVVCMRYSTYQVLTSQRLSQCDWIKFFRPTGM